MASRAAVVVVVYVDFAGGRVRGTTASARHTRPARRAVAVALVAAVEVVASAHGRAMAAVVGGFSRRGGGEVPGASSYAVQMAALKGEDAFVAAPEVSGRAPTGGGARRRSRRRDRANARAAVADLLACYAVFDGHVNADASAHAEREMLDALVACVAAAPPAAPLESACDAAFRAVEASFAKSDPARPASWPCVACRGRSAPRGAARPRASSSRSASRTAAAAAASTAAASTSSRRTRETAARSSSLSSRTRGAARLRPPSPPSPPTLRRRRSSV